MVKDFWRKFFELTKNAIVIFIDGKGDKLTILQELWNDEFAAT
jgi:hypothetical protein